MARAKSISIVTGWEEGVNFRRFGIQWWELKRDAIIKVVMKDGRILILRIKAGFQWNGASVPWAAHWYASPEDFLQESLFHDWGYTYHWFWSFNDATQKWEKMSVSKFFTDGLFHDMLMARKVRVTKADVMWAAVGFGGWFSWWNATCNDDCIMCPCDAGGWCPERNDLEDVK